MELKYVILATFFLILKCISAVRYDCCLAELSSFGKTCSYSGTSYGNETYYCVSVTEICPNCMLSSDVDIESANCYQCCSTDANSCGISISFISTSTWCKYNLFFSCCATDHAINSRSIISDITALICIIFAGSCCCCSIVFLSAEHSRLKEGLTFREAYLIPIPLVAAEIDSGDKDYLFPPDQPTAIARAQTSIDIPVAEPTEHSSLVGHHHADRSTLWQ